MNPKGNKQQQQRGRRRRRSLNGACGKQPSTRTSVPLVGTCSMPGSGLGTNTQLCLTRQQPRHMWGEAGTGEEKRQERGMALRQSWPWREVTKGEGAGWEKETKRTFVVRRQTACHTPVALGPQCSTAKAHQLLPGDSRWRGGVRAGSSGAGI